MKSKQVTKFKETEIGKIPNEWKIQKLHQVCKFVSVGYVGPTSKFFCSPTDGIKFLRSQNVRPGRLDLSNTKFVTHEFHKKFKKSQLFAGDILIVRVGQNRGDCCIVPENLGELNCANIVFARPDPNYSDFLGYYLQSPSGKNSLNAISTGTAQGVLNTKSIAEIKVPIPRENEAKIIASNLNALYNIIKNLQNQNKILEQIIQTIFKSWFIDFDGIKEFENSELGKIPKGWQIGKIKDVIKIFDNQRIPMSSMDRINRKGIFPYYGAATIIDYIDDYIFDGVFLLLGEDGSVIRDDGTPFVQYVDGQIWVNNHTHVIQGNGKISTEFLMLFFKKLNITPWVTGTTQLKINQTNLLSIPLIIPEENILKKFDEIVTPLCKNILKNEKFISSLSKIRDSLLPKLMSGEIRV